MRSAKNRVVVGPGDEVPPGAAHRAEARRNGVEQLLQARAAGEPELVGVGVQNPVRAEVGRGEPRHPRDPLALAEVVAGLADQVEHAFARVALEDLRGRVLRAVVGRDDEIDARMQVVRDLRVDDVGLVADEEGHDELHAAVEPSPGPGDPLGSERVAMRAPPEAPAHPEQGELRAIRAGSHATSRADRAGAANRLERGARRSPRRPSRHQRLVPSRACTAARHRARSRARADPPARSVDEPYVVGMRERGAGNEREIRAPNASATADAVPLVPVALVVDAPERQPARRRPRSRRTPRGPPRAVREPTRPPSRSRLAGPSPRGRRESGSQPSTVRSSTRRARRAPARPSTRRARARRRRVGRDDDDALAGRATTAPMIAA